MFKKILKITVVLLLLFTLISCINSQNAPSWIVGEWQSGIFNLKFSKTKAIINGVELTNKEDGVKFESPSPKKFNVVVSKGGLSFTNEFEKINDTQIKYLTLNQTYTKKTQK